MKTSGRYVDGARMNRLVIVSAVMGKGMVDEVMGYRDDTIVDEVIRSKVQPKDVEVDASDEMDKAGLYVAADTLRHTCR